MHKKEILDLIVIQAGKKCNLNCNYCYISKESRKSNNKMSMEVLEKIVSLVFKFKQESNNNKIEFLFHAGEPLAVGLKWYENALNIINNLNKNKLQITYSIQTNGTMINQKWCDFFKRHNFQIGVSCDGPEFLHDLNRKNWLNKGSYQEMVKGIKLLNKNALNYGSIAVITKESLLYPEEIVSNAKKLGFKSIAFNVEETEGSNSNSKFFTNNNHFEYKLFLSKILKYSKLHNVYFREYENMKNKIIDFLLNDISNDNYNISLIPLKILTFNTNGDVFTFCPELSNDSRWVIGNVMSTNSIEDLYLNNVFKEMYEQIKKGINLCEQQCEYFFVCNGGKPGNKYFENASFTTSYTESCNYQVKDVFDVVYKSVTK